MTFAADTLSGWEQAPEIEIETSRGAGAAVHKTTIWIVVSGNQAYVRSVRGPAGRWYRELMANPFGAVHLAGKRVAVRAVPAADATTIRHVSEALDTKYRERWAGPTAAMLRDDVLPTTLRLEPVGPG
ncbi:MAG TPA: DUF2255 family protein [Chloroflexota bacterium]|nr:DUF2255 family protein [Chloroflexota bacterium]